jgi:hypothetical protein
MNKCLYLTFISYNFTFPVPFSAHLPHNLIAPFPLTAYPLHHPIPGLPTHQQS